MSILVLVFYTHFPQVGSFSAVPGSSWVGKGSLMWPQRIKHTVTRINSKWYRLGLQTSSMTIWGCQQMFFPKTTTRLDKTVKDWKLAKGIQQTKKYLFVKITAVQVKTASGRHSGLQLLQAPQLCVSSCQHSRAGPGSWWSCCGCQRAHWCEYGQSECNLSGKGIGRARVSASWRLWSSGANSGRQIGRI